MHAMTEVAFSKHDDIMVVEPNRSLYGSLGLKSLEDKVEGGLHLQEPCLIAPTKLSMLLWACAQ